MEGKVVFYEEKLRDIFKDLKESDPDFYKELQKAREEISKNIFCGRQVRKKLIPKEFIKKYNLNNLWIYNLRSGWRLLYVITNPTKVEIIAVILDWMNHKDYEKLFKF